MNTDGTAAFNLINKYRLDVLHSVCAVVKRTPDGDVSEPFRWNDVDTLITAVNKVVTRLEKLK